MIGKRFSLATGLDDSVEGVGWSDESERIKEAVDILLDGAGEQCRNEKDGEAADTATNVNNLG